MTLMIKGMPQWKQVFQGNVLAFGLVSFFTDLSSEMIYPLLPVFFSGLLPAAGVAVYIGLMEGLAESTASLLKFYSGHLSDRLDRRKPLVLIGYGLSSLVRPFTALAVTGWQVVALRLFDRIGKGIRTAPRDALLSESVTAGIRGRAFSFHRMMDHTGAIAGPVLSIAFLYLMLGRTMLWHQGNASTSPNEMFALRLLFGFAALPGLAAVIVLWKLVREDPRSENTQLVKEKEKAPQRTKLPSKFYIFLSAVTLFTLGNSSDLFLIFYARTKFELGPGWVINLWILLHVSKTVFSMPGGWVADRFGRRVAIISGWFIYAVVYCVIPFVDHFGTIFLIFIIYGSFYGMTEGAERALVADFVTGDRRGVAYGWYHAAVGLAALPASLLFGVFWAQLGPKVAFLIGASLAAGAVVILLCALPRKKEMGAPGKST